MNSLLFRSSLLFSPIYQTNENTINHYPKEQFERLHTTPNTREGDEAIIKFLAHKNYGSFVLKQVKNEPLKHQLKLAIEHVASTIGKQAGIPLPDTYLIPKQWVHSGKVYPLRAAILVRKVDGIAVEDLDLNIDIHQRSRPTDMEKELNTRYGPLALESTGLSLKVIHNMNKHPDLIKLCAFDTFISNSDRSRPNIFYNREHDHYYGIDQLAAFRDSKLSHHALRQLKDIKPKLTENDMISIRKYTDILSQLYQIFSAKKVISMIEQSLDDILPEYKQDESCIALLNEYKSFITNHWRDTKDLIEYLELNFKCANKPKVH